MKTNIILISAFLLIILTATNTAAAEVYTNPKYYSDSAEFKITNSDDSIFELFVFDTNTGELVSVVTLDSKESCIIKLPGRVYYDFFLHSKTKEKWYKNYYIKSGGNYYLRRG